MGRLLRVLIVEDSADDTELLLEELRRGGYEPQYRRVETADAMRAALRSEPWDLVVSDHSAPRFNSLAALRVLTESDLDIPFIIVSGTIGEDAAVEAMKAGAHDYIAKGRLARLIPAVARELSEAEHRRARRTAEQRLRQQEQQAAAKLAHAYEAALEGWARALDLRDHETEGHSRRVTEMTLKLAERLGVPEADRVHIRRGALLHDIGKMGVPDRILHKPGPLTPEEQAIMRRHPLLARQLLEPIAYLAPAIDIPYCHHEKWDGTGYPQGLKGEAIPLAARIFAVADVWDAIRSDRPYRRGWPADRALQYIRTIAGTHLDPTVVDAFVQLIGEEASARTRQGDPGAERASSEQVRRPEEIPEPADRPRAVILLVDDDPGVRAAARQILEAGRYEVVEAANGFEGLAALEAGRTVDLLIADVKMPEMSGDEMVRLLRTQHPRLKVLYVTGHVDRLFVGRQFLWEEEAFLEKPFTPEGLLEAVSLLLYGAVHRPAPRRRPKR